MTIYFDQIPEGIDISEYPEGTLFVLDDSKPKRDPITLQLIRPPKRPLVYPQEMWAAHSK